MTSRSVHKPQTVPTEPRWRPTDTARLLEHEAKRFLSDTGIGIPKSVVVSRPEEAFRFTETLRKPVVLKGLIPVGGRQKLGAVKIAATPEESAGIAKSLLGQTFADFPVERILVEERLEIQRELYVSISNDTRTRRPLILLGSRGGVDIEKIYMESPESMIQESMDPLRPLEVFQARHLWLKLRIAGSLLVELTAFLHKLYSIFTRLDTTLLEVNPIAMTPDGRAVAASCVLEVDDDALYRHPELEGKVVKGLDRVWRPLTEREKVVMQIDLEDPSKGDIRYTDFDGGNIGFVCGGGGGSLTMQDAVRAFGGRPANYSEWGGNPSARKMETLTRVVLSKPGVKGLLVCLNISSNTRIDVAASGIVKALRDLKVSLREFPVVVRLAGLNDGFARTMFEGAGFEYHGEDLTMEEAAALIVRKVEKSE